MTYQRARGQVVQAYGGQAKVKIPRTASCQSCSEHGECCAPFGSDFMLVEAQNRVGAGEGQNVEIEFATPSSNTAVLFLYIIPLFALILGAVAGYNLALFGSPDGSAALLSLVFLVLSYLGVHRLHRLLWGRDARYRPRITRLLGREGDEPLLGSQSRGTGGCSQCFHAK
jgi:sigma-E factor negative regulatory protein RseC